MRADPHRSSVTPCLSRLPNRAATSIARRSAARCPFCLLSSFPRRLGTPQDRPVSCLLLIDPLVAARHLGRREASHGLLPTGPAVDLVHGAAQVASSSSVSPISPVTPCVTISGTEPRRRATTGVPQASASAITSPNGSGQSIGKSSASALPRSSGFSASPISPTSSTWPLREQRPDHALVVLPVSPNVRVAGVPEWQPRRRPSAAARPAARSGSRDPAPSRARSVPGRPGSRRPAG